LVNRKTQKRCPITNEKMARTRQAPKRKYVEPDTDDEFEEEEENEEEGDAEVQTSKKSKTSKFGEWINGEKVFILKHKNFAAGDKKMKIASFDFVCISCEIIL
jgi:glutamyl/glutaminyl-tRNA synthetase